MVASPGLMLPRASIALLALLLASGCRSRDEPPPAPLLSASLAAPAPAPPPPPPSAPASASASGPTRVSPTFADLQQRASGAPPWPSGPGVACGEARCAAGEFCCDGGGEKRCLPRSRVAECLEARSTAMECDESSDCGAGQICCFGIIYEKEARHVACKTPAVCRIPISRPGSFPYPGRELCARGGACRDPKLVCIENERMPAGAECMSKIGAVSCLEKTCRGDRPWCLWDPGTRTAECIPRGPWEHEDGVNSCDGPEDCVGGEACCSAGSRAFCSMDCTEAWRFTSEVCHRDADCPRSEAGSRHCVEGGDEARKPGVKECRQSDRAQP